jgi:hypothetical protein
MAVGPSRVTQASDPAGRIERAIRAVFDPAMVPDIARGVIFGLGDGIRILNRHLDATLIHPVCGAHLSITHSGSQVDHLALSKMKQLLGGYLAQRVGHQVFRADWMRVHGDPFHRGRFSDFRWDGGICRAIGRADNSIMDVRRTARWR